MVKKIFLATIMFSSSLNAKSYTLNQCIDIALKNNPDIVVLTSSYESSKAKVKESRSSYWPHLSANFTSTRRVSPLSITLGSTLSDIPGLSNTLDVITYTAGFSLQQNIWDFGRTSSIEAKAMAAEELALLKLERKKMEISYSVKKAYYNLLQAKAMEQVIALTLRDMETILSSVNARKQEGLATPLDVLNAESEYMSYKAELKKKEHQTEIAKILVMNIMGKSEDEPFNLSAENFPMPAPEESPLGLKSYDECRQKAILQRSEIKELELQEKIVNASISSAVAEWLPNIAGSGTYDFTDNSFPPKQNSWSIGLTVSLPLFSGFGSIARLEQAKEDLKSIAPSKQQLIQGIIVQVKENYYKVLEEKENIKVAKKKLEYLEKNMEALNAKYNEGLANLTELIEAQTKKAGMDIENQQVLYNYYTALNELEYTIGGLK